MPCTSRILTALRFLRRHAYSYRTRLIGIMLLYALISCWGIEGLLEAAPTDTAHSTVTLRAAGTPTATRSGPNALISTSATSTSATSVATVGTAFADMGDNEPSTVAAVHNNTLLQCAVCGTPKKGCLLDVPVIVISAEGSQRHLHLANEHSRYVCGTRMLMSPFVNPTAPHKTTARNETRAPHDTTARNDTTAQNDSTTRRQQKRTTAPHKTTTAPRRPRPRKHLQSVQFLIALRHHPRRSR